MVYEVCMDDSYVRMDTKKDVVFRIDFFFFQDMKTFYVRSGVHKDWIFVFLDKNLKKKRAPYALPSPSLLFFSVFQKRPKMLIFSTFIEN